MTLRANLLPERGSESGAQIGWIAGFSCAPGFARSAEWLFRAQSEYLVANLLCRISQRLRFEAGPRNAVNSRYARPLARPG